MPSKKQLLVVMLIGGAVAVDVACSQVPLDGRPCPCIVGYVCCNDVCEQDSYGCDGAKAKGDDDDSTVSRSTDQSIRKLTKPGDATPKCMTADPTTVFWMNEDGIVAAGSTVSGENVRSRINPSVTKVKACSLLRSGDGLYVATAEGNAIQWLSVSSDGANPVVGERSFHFATFNAPVGLAQDASYIYARDGVTGQVRRLPKAEAPGETEDAGTLTDAGAIPDGGTVASAGTLLGTGNAGASSLILAGDMLYWFDNTGLRRMSKTGGPISTLSSIDSSVAVHGVHDLGASADALFWIEYGQLITVPIAGGVAHLLPYTPAQWLPPGSSATSFFSSSGVATVHGDDDDDDTTSTKYKEDGPLLDTLAISDRGLILGHRTTVGLLGFQGGKELGLFRFLPPSTTNDTSKGMTTIIFDTSRFIWISGDGNAIHYRPLLETDPKLPPP